MRAEQRRNAALAIISTDAGIAIHEIEEQPQKPAISLRRLPGAIEMLLSDEY
jgi:hypothetical protein